MAILDSITVGERRILVVDADPTVTGVAATLGSLVLLSDGTGIYQKTNTADTNWSKGITAANLTDITSVGTITTGTWNATAIGATFGGTGQTSYTVGDILYASATTALSKLTAVAAGAYLRSAGTRTAPVWSTLRLPNAATTGDILYASASNTISALADVATGNALISGGVGAAPSWGKIGLTTHVSGTLPVANGGTGNTTGQATLMNDSASTTTLQDVTSTSYVDATGITLTPGAGTYLVIVSGYADMSTGAATGSIIINSNGSTVATTECQTSSTSMNSFATQTITTLAAAQIVKVQYKTTLGTCRVRACRMTLIKISP